MSLRDLPFRVYERFGNAWIVICATNDCSEAVRVTARESGRRLMYGGRELVRCGIGDDAASLLEKVQAKFSQKVEKMN